VGASRRYRRRCTTGRRVLATIDVRGTVHGHAIDHITAADRAWFERHPGETVRSRPAADHEFCDPKAFPGCIPAFEVPPASLRLVPVLMVEVTKVTPWFRTRQPYWVLEPIEVAS
jgi:hypothetical protein